jgi:hypothetical protein
MGRAPNITPLPVASPLGEEMTLCGGELLLPSSLELHGIRERISPGETETLARIMHAEAVAARCERALARAGAKERKVQASFRQRDLIEPTTEADDIDTIRLLSQGSTIAEVARKKGVSSTAMTSRMHNTFARACEATGLEPRVLAMIFQPRPHGEPPDGHLPAQFVGAYLDGPRYSGRAINVERAQALLRWLGVVEEVKVAQAEMDRFGLDALKPFDGLRGPTVPSARS